METNNKPDLAHDSEGREENQKLKYLLLERDAKIAELEKTLFPASMGFTLAREKKQHPLLQKPSA